MKSSFTHPVPKRERLLQQVCPSGIEEQGESYFLGRLPRADAARFEEHLLLCSHCVQRVLRTMTFLEEMGRLSPHPGTGDTVSAP